MRRFNKIDGTTLYKMSEADFVATESQYGKVFYCILQQLKEKQDQQMAYDSNKCEFFFFFFFFCCKYTLCEGSLHVACSVQNGKMGWAALVCCDVNPLNPELNPICYLLALLGAHHFLHVSRIRVKLLTFRRVMSYIYMEHPFLMFLDHTQRQSTVGRTPLDE